MPEWLETGLAIASAVAAVFFFAKYRETVAALHESERMKQRLSKDLDRYRDVSRLRKLRDALVSADALPVDDEGREHLLIRDGDQHLHHLTLSRRCNPVGEGETVSLIKKGEEVALSELE